MRQSLSENRSTYTHPPEPTTRNWPAAARAVLLAIVLSAVLVVVAIIDQTGGRSLADHVTTMYAPYGKRPDPSLLYGLVYAVAAIGALLWLLVLRVVQSRGRSAPILTVVVTTVTAALALLLLVSSEYGAQIFPPLWGILAVLPPAAGILAAVLLRRRSGRTVLRLWLPSGQVSERTSATSYSATEAPSIAALCSSEGPLPRNASTAARDSQRSNMSIRPASTRSAVMAKSRQPGARRACFTTLTQSAR